MYDGINPVQETSGAAVLANILTGLNIDEFLTRTDVAAGTTSHFLPDLLGSALALADSAGTIQTEYTYEPFGKTTVTGVSNTNPFQYTSRETDGTGIYYYRARYYHPQLQRFISEDPIEFEGGDINLYAYVGNNSVNFTDPFGLLPFSPGLPAGLPGGPTGDTPNPAMLIDFMSSVMAVTGINWLSREIARKVDEFEKTIDCGKQVVVVICILKTFPLGSVIVAQAVYLPPGQYTCTKYTVTGRKNCCIPRP